MKGTTEVTYQVLVQPAQDKQTALALWLLEQDPGIRTASPNSFHVPADLFKVVPEELLDGALVDGRAYRAVVDGLVPDGDGYAPADVVPVDDGAQPEAVPLTEIRLPAKPRNRRARKAVSQHPTGKAVKPSASSRQVPTSHSVAAEDVAVSTASEAQVSE